MSQTLRNLEKALAGESTAHIKYRYFAKLAREEGFEDVARHFEETADQEIKHAWGHLELLVGKPSTKQCLQMAIDGETYEYTEMYTNFQETANKESNDKIALEFLEQMNESKEHSDRFKALMEKAEKRFAALKKVEERHANAYKKVLEAL